MLLLFEGVDRLNQMSVNDFAERFVLDR
jgi:hypothetical protein